MAQGKVKWFSKERGYGFISPLSGGEEVFVEDFFVRNSGVAGARSTTLEEGERVLYQVTRDEWGPTAENVCILQSSHPAVRQPAEDEARNPNHGFRPSYDRGGAKYMADGRIKWYSPQLGHGFILCEDPLGDVFMLCEDITGGDPWSLDTGDKVTFEVVDAPEGRESRTVFKLS